MNNRIYIASAVSESTREWLLSHQCFDRFGDASLVARHHCFGFELVEPERRWWRILWRLLNCTYIFLPRNWYKDEYASLAFVIADLLGKITIYGEDVCK